MQPYFIRREKLQTVVSVTHLTKRATFQMGLIHQRLMKLFKGELVLGPATLLS